MPYIKKLVMHGFKSFVKKTEVPFTRGINVILGPNGSGKSNISDALCFVLGRLSIKSMRAAKSKNLIFLGSKVASPAKEAMVEIVFDNSDKAFSIDQAEISIKRIVRRNGQGIYKINNEAKTRQEVLLLLAQAGIDPHGFNIILQGEIQNFVEMHTDERRKVIEEVSGVSIYESRKLKSLKELEKTDEKLKEISAILHERTAYLNNLEKERQQALRFKKLEDNIKMYRGSIIFHDLEKKKKETEKINSGILEKTSEIEKTKKSISSIKTAIAELESRINSINLGVHELTGLEQEKINQEIADIRAELAGLNVKRDNHKNKISEILNNKQELSKAIKENEILIKELKKESPLNAKKERDLELKKQELDEIEGQRRKFYMIKSELKSINEIIDDKNSFFQSCINESDFLLKEINSLTLELSDKNTDSEKLSNLRFILSEKKELLNSINKEEKEIEKILYANENEIDRHKNLMNKLSKMDICPICKSRITESHINSIHEETSQKINFLKKEIDSVGKKSNEIYKRKEFLERDIEYLNLEILRKESDLVKISGINEKKRQLKSLQEKKEKSKNELLELKKRKNLLEKKFNENFNIDQRYENVKIEVQEISLRTEENISSEISFKQMGLERLKVSFKQILMQESELNEELSKTEKDLKEKEKSLEKKKNDDEDLNRKFKKLFSQKDDFQKKIRDEESKLLEKQNIIYQLEQNVNNFKIERAKVDAGTESLEIEMSYFSKIKPIKISRELLLHKLNKAQETISKIGSVNLRSLEVYNSVRADYDSIRGKAEIISKEKEGILKVIHEIDIKKKKSFLKTLHSLNELFSKNFSQLSSKGHIFLELEDKKNPFEGGVNIIVKSGHGKYFDVTSLSGGEKTLAALSLIFAIQEFSPYYFYVLDEIDAALDKRNSERLAELLRRYMKKGQYIVITHNDEIISNSTNLYGVSMHEGISKILSINLENVDLKNPDLKG